MKKNKITETLFTLIMLAAATAISFAFFYLGNKNVANITVIYTLALILTALYTTGYLYGIISALYCVIAVNYFFSYPYFKFNFSMDGYPVTFVGMLAIALITSTTTTALKKQRNAIAEREKALIEADKEKLRANLLRSISHDLRTPLTSISGNASNLLSHGDLFDTKTKEQMYTDIYDDALWLINLVENLLSVSRLEEGRMNLHVSTELIDEVVAEALRHINRKSVDYHLKVQSSEEYLLAQIDAKLIVQVLINLIDKGNHKQDMGDARVGNQLGDKFLFTFCKRSQRRDGDDHRVNVAQQADGNLCHFLIVRKSWCVDDIHMVLTDHNRIFHHRFPDGFGHRFPLSGEFGDIIGEFLQALQLFLAAVLKMDGDTWLRSIGDAVYRCGRWGGVGRQYRQPQQGVDQTGFSSAEFANDCNMIFFGFDALQFLIQSGCYWIGAVERLQQFLCHQQLFIKFKFQPLIIYPHRAAPLSIAWIHWSHSRDKTAASFPI